MALPFCNRRYFWIVILLNCKVIFKYISIWTDCRHDTQILLICNSKKDRSIFLESHKHPCFDCQLPPVPLLAGAISVALAGVLYGSCKVPLPMHVCRPASREPGATSRAPTDAQRPTKACKPAQQGIGGWQGGRWMGQRVIGMGVGRTGQQRVRRSGPGG